MMEKQQRLIDADALLSRALEEKRFVFTMYDRIKNEYIVETVYKDLADFINEAPTIDAEPVRNGHVVWKNRFMGGFVPDITITDKFGEKHTGTLDTTHYEPVPYCSECGKELGVSSLAYCPNCGAKMDGGAGDDHQGT